MALPYTPDEQQKLEQKVIKMAKYYLWPFKKRTQKDVGEKFGVSGSTVGKYFKTILPTVSPKLAKKVQAKVERVAMQNRFKPIKR